MAKNYRKRNIIPVETKSNNGSSPSKEITTSRGIKIRLVGLPPMFAEKLDAQFDTMLPEIPTYQLITVAGDVETHLHNDTTLDVLGDEEQTSKNKIEWEYYVKERNRVEQLRSTALMKMTFMKGIVGIDIDEEWIAEQKFIGMNVPENPLERRYHYITTEIVGSTYDMQIIMRTIMELTGVSKEDLQEADSMFQRAVEESSSEGSNS